MRLPAWLLDVFIVEYLILTIGFIVFTVGYAWLTRGDWRRNVGGRLLMALGSSCSIILSLSILRLFLPEHRWRIYATAIALLGLVGVVIWLNVLLFSRQLGMRKDHPKREDQKT